MRQWGSQAGLPERHQSWGQIDERPCEVGGGRGLKAGNGKCKGLEVKRDLCVVKANKGSVSEVLEGRKAADKAEMLPVVRLV